MGEVHGALGPLGPSWPRAQGHGEGRREDGGGKAHRTKAMGSAKKIIPYHVSQTLNHVSCDVKHTIFTAFKHAVCRVMHHIG